MTRFQIKCPQCGNTWGFEEVRYGTFSLITCLECREEFTPDECEHREKAVVYPYLPAVSPCSIA